MKVSEFSGEFEKLLKFWWGKAGRLSGLGRLTSEPLLITRWSPESAQIDACCLP